MAEQSAIFAKRVAITTTYFEGIDNGDLTVIDLMSDDIEFCFPKLGVRKGKEELKRFIEWIGKNLNYIKHDISGFNYISQGNHLVVEGREKGETADGELWPDGDISQGLFCSLFEFEGEFIKRMFIYVDPDFTSRDTDRVKALRSL